MPTNCFPFQLIFHFLEFEHEIFGCSNFIMKFHVFHNSVLPLSNLNFFNHVCFELFEDSCIFFLFFLILWVIKAETLDTHQELSMPALSFSFQ